MGGAFQDDDDEKSFAVQKLEQLLEDIFLLTDVKKLHYMAAPPMAATAKNITDGLYNVISNAKYSRKTKYFEKGEPKYKGSFVKLLPTFLRRAAFQNKD